MYFDLPQKIDGVTLRENKDAALTHAEMDMNFKLLKIVGSFFGDVINAFVKRDELPSIRSVSEASAQGGWYRVDESDVGRTFTMAGRGVMFFTLGGDLDTEAIRENGDVVPVKPGIVLIEIIDEG